MAAGGAVRARPIMFISVLLPEPPGAHDGDEIPPQKYPARSRARHAIHFTRVIGLLDGVELDEGAWSAQEISAG